jgi:transcriptional regulator with XRE-family HTH domain
MTTIGLLVKEIRRIHELSQRALAERLGVSAAYIAQIELDRVAEPLAFLKSIRHLMTTDHVNAAIDIMTESHRIKLAHELLGLHDSAHADASTKPAHESESL